MSEYHKAVYSAWAARMYAWCQQKINNCPAKRTHFLRSQHYYETVYLDMSDPITIDQILQP